MSQALKAQEPSMEEILASIRRIIADDEAGKPAAPAAKAEPAFARPTPAEPASRPAAAPMPTARDMMEALDLPQPQPPAVEPPPATQSAAARQEPAIDPLDALEAEIAATAMSRSAEEEPPAIEPAPVSTVAPPREEFAVTTEPALVSAQTSEAVNSAFNALAHTMLAHNTERLDDLARQMLRPMLKAWLDDNLPTIVERLVRAEIERVARGR